MINVIEVISDLMFPKRCPFCGVISVEREICVDCKHDLKLVDSNYVCDFPWNHNSLISGIYPVFYYNSTVKGAVCALKFKGRTSVARGLAGLMSARIGRVINDLNDIDVIIPVPVHKNRKRIRGYNQSALIAREIGKNLHIPVDEKTLIRRRDTVPQTSLSGEKRLTNLEDAFLSFDLPGKKILLIDDVITTGTTIRCCANVLKDAGAEKIYCSALAMTHFNEKNTKIIG